MKRFFKVFIILILCQAALSAQVKLLLDFNAKTNVYTVSMMPERTWTAPNNLAATGQITLKATTGQFHLLNIQNHVENIRWVESGRVNAPEESNKYDYIFFRLMTQGGLTEMPFHAFKPTKLFSFALKSDCAREVMLVSNVEDAFLPPNSRNVNIGNSLGVLGANGEAYTGNISSLPIFCPRAAIPDKIKDTDSKPLITSKQEASVAVDDKLLYPNPTNKILNMKLDWQGTIGAKTVLAYNGAGELVRFFSIDLKKGKNEHLLDLGELDSGIYNFLLVDNEQTLSLGKIIKVQ